MVSWTMWRAKQVGATGDLSQYRKGGIVCLLLGPGKVQVAKAYLKKPTGSNLLTTSLLTPWQK